MELARTETHVRRKAMETVDHRFAEDRDKSGPLNEIGGGKAPYRE